MTDDDGTVWPPPPDIQEETAAKQSSLPVDRKPNYFLLVLKGMGLNLLTYWFFLIAGNVFFPQKVGRDDYVTGYFFWITCGLSLGANALMFAKVPRYKTYSAYLTLGAALMSGVSCWFVLFILGFAGL